MLEIEIDGKAVEVDDGSTVMDAAHKLGTYIPHFCYHKKLSIAANCRMCLVQVEKVPKPLPACATPVTAGMKVWTHSENAIKAQKGVMEFLLINHPLDCPICDQGGECQLQDLAVGYGSSAARYQEEKRVVINKNLGPLISTDMTRCIHCTRCVRFGQEIAGVMELGMANRGEHSEIMAFVNQTVDSELSGNMIDLCPVGALTSKPFRFSARTWELSRRKSISPHDSLGTNLIVQTKHDQVKRVLPLENEEINECWISDRDRFSYEALNSEERLTRPMLKQGGKWQAVDWQTALEYVANTLKGVIAEHGAGAIGALLSPHSTLEELYLAQKLMRALGSENIDSRLRQTDFSLDTHLAGAPWLGMPIEQLSEQDAVVVVGSFLRKDQPLIAQRLRQAVKKGTRLCRVHVAADDWLMPLHADSIVAPDQMVRALGEILKALANFKDTAIPAACLSVAELAEPSEQSIAIARSLADGEQSAIVLGNYALQHAQAGLLHILAQEIAAMANAKFGVLGEAANSTGAYLVGATAVQGGLNAAQMIDLPRKAYLVLGCEPELDCANGMAALNALKGAASVIYMGAFGSVAAADYADVMLPIAPFAETSGTYVNCEGKAQSFHAVVKAQGEVRPAWKVLRVLGNLLDLQGFDYDSSYAVLREALPADIEARLKNVVSIDVAASLFKAAPAVSTHHGLQRIADIPIYFTDPLVRRAPSLQKTRDASLPTARMSDEQLRALQVNDGEAVRIQSKSGEIVLKVQLDDSVRTGCVRIAGAHASTLALGGLSGELTVERA